MFASNASGSGWPLASVGSGAFVVVTAKRAAVVATMMASWAATFPENRALGRDVSVRGCRSSVVVVVEDATVMEPFVPGQRARALLLTAAEQDPPFPGTAATAIAPEVEAV